MRNVSSSHCGINWGSGFHQDLNARYDFNSLSLISGWVFFFPPSLVGRNESHWCLRAATIYPKDNFTSCQTWDRKMVLDPSSLVCLEFKLIMRSYSPGVDVLSFLLCFPSVCFMTCGQGRVCASMHTPAPLPRLPVRTALVVMLCKILTGWHSLSWQLILIKGVLGGVVHAWGMFFFSLCPSEEVAFTRKCFLL